jgi:hypothetical protein
MHEPPPFDREGLIGAALWSVALAAVVAAIGHDVWLGPLVLGFRHTTFAEKVELVGALATVALATATAVLAAVTARSMRAEEGRHRERFAPLIRMQLAVHRVDASEPMVGLTAQNVGLGPALHIAVVANYAGALSPLDTKISALAVGESLDIGNDELRTPRACDRTLYGRVTATYEDVFGFLYVT